MNSILNYLKKGNFDIPLWLGETLSHIPYNLRPGIGDNYAKQKLAISTFMYFEAEAKKEYIFNRFIKIFAHAYNSVPFYNRLYKSEGIEIEDIKNFESISKVPVIKKRDLLDVPLEERSYDVKGRTIVNTGGSSGKTLSFYMDPLRFGNEWAHIHHMWSFLGYKPSSLKLSFDGRSKVRNHVQYDFVRHSLRVDIYADKYLVGKRIIEIGKKNPIEYLHGYPSAIYEFAIHCRDNDNILLAILKKTLKGAFFSSEYPSPHYREAIESIFEIPSQSFYGHTETCVMAMEKNRFEYDVFQTYGLAEAIKSENGSTDLIGTSYFNFASPLIRYNTEDEIKIVNSNNGILESFKIDGGRLGDFIVDKKGKKIPLTGLIFGRHHKLFNLCDHIQIEDNYLGTATIYYSTSKELPTNVENLFDFSNVAIDFKFVKIDKPILTKAGKVNLLVKST